MCACVCVYVWVGGKYVHVPAHVSMHRGACARTMPMFLANPPIQADINAIDCNWAVMCGI